MCAEIEELSAMVGDGKRSAFDGLGFAASAGGQLLTRHLAARGISGLFDDLAFEAFGRTLATGTKHAACSMWTVLGSLWQSTLAADRCCSGAIRPSQRSPLTSVPLMAERCVAGSLGLVGDGPALGSSQAPLGDVP